MLPVGPFNNSIIDQIHSTSKVQSKIDVIDMLNKLFSSASLIDDMDKIENYLKNHTEALVKEEGLFLLEKIDYDSIFASGEFAGLTLLDLAARFNFINVVQFLINECTDVSLLNKGNPVYQATWYGNTRIVRLLIENKFDYQSATQWSDHKGNTPLFIAASLGHTEVVKILINLGVDCKSAMQCGVCIGETPIIGAASNGYTEIAKLLIDHGVDFNLPIQEGKIEGQTPIFTAAANGHSEVVKLLIENRVDDKSALQRGFFKGQTPIFTAACNGHTEVVKLLIENKIDYQSAIGDVKGGTPIFAAASNGHTEVVKLLIDNEVDCDKSIQEGEVQGQTPIFVAAGRGHLEVVKLLIDHGVDYKSALKCGTFEGKTPVYIAASNGYIEVVKLLIDHGVDFKSSLKSGAYKGYTPVFVAAANGHTEVVRLLIENGVDFNTTLRGCEEEGQTLIFMAAASGNVELVKMLIEKKVNFQSALESGINKGLTPLYIAARCGHSAVVKVLIENKADYQSVVQSGYTKGFTPIATAAANGHTEIVKLLIEKGVDCKIALQKGQWEGETPIYMAAGNGHVEVVKVLIDHGVDCKLALQRGQKEGETPICFAIWAGHTEVAKVLIEYGIDGTLPVQKGQFKGFTPFALALMNGLTEIVRLFIEEGINYTSALGKNPTLIAGGAGHFEIVKLLIKHDVYLICQTSMPSKIHEIYYNEQKRENLILDLLSKKNPDKKFSFNWIICDNLVYLSVKSPSALFCEQGRRVLESKGVQVTANNDELHIRKSQTNQLIKFLDVWLRTCKLLEQLSNLFEKRILEQFTPAENGIVINLKPFELVIFGRIFTTLNAKVEADGCVSIPFELEANLVELKKSANMYTEKINRVRHLANTNGKAKIEYTENELQIRFKDEENLKKFAEILPFCKTTDNSLELICSYDDILDFNLVAPVRSFSPNTVDRKSTCIASFKRALEPLIPNYNKWTNEEKFIEAELSPHFLAILKAVSIPGLSILEQKKIRVMVENVEQFSEEEFNRIACGVKENQNKISAFERVFRRVSAKEGRLLNGQGYVFCFKDDDHKKCFESQFENVLMKAEGENQFLVTYSNALKLDQEKLLLVFKNIEKLTPLVQVVRPVQTAQAVSHNNGPLVAVKKVQKKTKKKNETKASVDSKPSAVASATKRSNGPNIAPQREIVWPKFERTTTGVVQTSLEIDYTRKKAVPTVVLMNKKVALTDYEACIKHELEFLKGLCTWYDELDNDSKNDFADIYCDSLWLGLLRFYNAVYMRAKNAHKNYQKIVHLTNNDIDAKKIRACLIHYFRNGKNLTEHYENYVAKSMGKIVENDFKLPSQKVELKSLSSCLLLQECKTIEDFYPMVKEQFTWIVRYLDILKEKAAKQAKVLSDVFKCAVEGDMTDSSFRFLVHEAKAIEACLVKIGELHRYVKDDARFNRIINFIAKCRKLRNRITHQVGEEGYNPVSAETINRFAEEAKSLLEMFSSG